METDYSIRLVLLGEPEHLGYFLFPSGERSDMFSSKGEAIIVLTKLQQEDKLPIDEIETLVGQVFYSYLPDHWPTPKPGFCPVGIEPKIN